MMLNELFVGISADSCNPVEGNFGRGKFPFMVVHHQEMDGYTHPPFLPPSSSKISLLHLNCYLEKLLAFINADPINHSVDGQSLTLRGKAPAGLPEDFTCRMITTKALNGFKPFYTFDSGIIEPSILKSLKNVSALFSPEPFIGNQISCTASKPAAETAVVFSV